MRKLSNALLIETYSQAKILELHDDFLVLIETELKRRDLHLTLDLSEKNTAIRTMKNLTSFR